MQWGLLMILLKKSEYDMSYCDEENEASIEQEAKNFMKLICMKKSY